MNLLIILTSLFVITANGCTTLEQHEKSKLWPVGDVK